MTLSIMGYNCEATRSLRWALLYCQSLCYMCIMPSSIMLCVIVLIVAILSVIWRHESLLATEIYTYIVPISLGIDVITLNLYKYSIMSIRSTLLCIDIEAFTLDIYGLMSMAKGFSVSIMNSILWESLLLLPPVGSDRHRPKTNLVTKLENNIPVYISCLFPLSASMSTLCNL